MSSSPVRAATGIAVFANLALMMAAGASKPPHVVFILADDLGFGDMGFTSQFEIQPGAGGQPYAFNPPRTPNLDAIALSESSLLFEQFYAGAPVCSPTRYGHCKSGALCAEMCLGHYNAFVDDQPGLRTVLAGRAC